MSEEVQTEAVAQKKPRAPRKDYGYAKDAVIRLTDKSPSYRGNRKSWYATLVEANGKTVAEWEAGQENARGWLRFFVADGAVELTKAA